jgi:hypothetical protein
MDRDQDNPVPDPRYRHDQPAGSQVAGAPSDNTSVTAVLERLAEDGFGTDFRPGGHPAALRCDQCGRESAVGDFTDLVEHRLEGASDPDDMVIVVAARCPECGARGKVVLGYGPASSDVDSDLVAALPPPG